MSTFLINCSNLKAGGGIQVAQSLLEQAKRFKKHCFIFVLTDKIHKLEDNDSENTKTFVYSIKNTFTSLFLGRDAYLDKMVANEKVDAVLTVFGPSRWQPKVPHLCGFARAQLVLTDSPYYKRLAWKEKLLYRLWTWQFKKSSDTFYTENKYISDMIPNLLGKKVKVHTVSNYYNQVFDMPETWRKHPLPEFDGTTSLSVSSYYPHKNFEIFVDAARVLKCKHPDFRFRFVLTFDDNQMAVPEDLKEHFLFIGRVDVSECPDLYRQADIMVMPTLLECFTATYPEAMRMNIPIVTTDMEFARGLCEDAACYYSAVDAKACADAIYKVSTDKEYASMLVKNGKEQLKKFDNYEQRADKLIGILEGMVKESRS